MKEWRTKGRLLNEIQKFFQSKYFLKKLIYKYL